MGILDGKRILVTGVLTEASIAFAAARIAQEQGAEVILSSFGRQMKITQVIAERLPQTPQVIELDATNEEDLAALPERLGGNITPSPSPRRMPWAESSSTPRGTRCPLPSTSPPTRSRPLPWPRSPCSTRAQASSV